MSISIRATTILFRYILNDRKQTPFAQIYFPSLTPLWGTRVGRYFFPLIWFGLSLLFRRLDLFQKVTFQRRQEMAWHGIRTSRRGRNWKQIFCNKKRETFLLSLNVDFGKNQIHIFLRNISARTLTLHVVLTRTLSLPWRPVKTL